MGLINDCFLYNGEREILKLRLSKLEGYVDKFIICEAKTTFTRQPKHLYFFRDQRYFRRWWSQIEYFVINENYPQEDIDLANNDWRFLQTESIKKALKSSRLHDDDMCFIGDVRDIWEASESGDILKLPAKLKLHTEDNRDYWGTYVATYGSLSDKVLHHERERTDIYTLDYHGKRYDSK